MNKLTRYLVLLAGLALALMTAVPAAMASDQKQAAGPDSRECAAAIIAVDKATKVLADLEKLVKPILDELKNVTEQEALAKLNAVLETAGVLEPAKEAVRKHIALIWKLLAAKKALREALVAKFNACKPPPKPGEYSQVKDVPVGAARTGGGPA